MHNETEPLISVILPVYNVSEYIDFCIESVRKQDYKNIEIILVCDGPTDDSGDKCDYYGSLDNRIVVIHKENGGISDARNVGAQHAHGEYITFIDSDDTVYHDYVSYLYSLIKKYQTKMSLGIHEICLKDKRIRNNETGKDECLDSKTCIKRMLYHDVIDTSAWAKMYHKDLLKNISYPKGKLFEDIGTTYKFFLASERIACGYHTIYSYCIRNNSIVTGSFNVKKYDLLEMTDKMGEDVLRYYPELRSGVLRRRVYARFSTLNQLLNVEGQDTERNNIIKFIKTHSSEIRNDKLAPKRDKVACVLLGLGYPVYKLAWSIMKKQYISCQKNKSH